MRGDSMRVLDFYPASGHKILELDALFCRPRGAAHSDMPRPIGIAVRAMTRP